MASKLPKPASGLKPPQFRLKPLGSISENVAQKTTDLKPTSKAFEAPPSTFTRPLVIGSRLNRRSKSVTDLSSLSGKALPDFRKFKAAPIKMPASASKVFTNNRTNVKASGTMGGVKRPLANNNKNDDGATKPKVSRKIPDWDYKSRFNQLNERYTNLQDNFKKMEARVSEFSDIETNYIKTKDEAKTLAEEKKKLIEQCSTLNEQNKAILQEVKEVKTLFDNLTRDYDTLTSDRKELNIKFDDLTAKSACFQREIKQLTDNLEVCETENRELKEIVALQKADLLKFETERRTLHNTIQDLKGNIRVFCRVRPPIPTELDKLECTINFIDENGLEIRRTRESISQITGKLQDGKVEFTFDKVFAPDSTQEEVFEDLAQLVQSALDGYDVCVFAYGPTGSGKTYTMQGSDGAAQGMIPRTIDLIFKNITKLMRSGWTYSIQASFLEIYNENVRDLLNKNAGQKMEICFNEGKGITVTNLTIQPIESAAELERHMLIAQSNRATATTDFNEHSSRSHAVTKIYLQGTHRDQNMVYNGSINLVDLAGSESAKQSVAGDRLNETKNINKSLATLGDVICALYNKTKHIPYRNSKLTYLLQSCLGGNSKTLMIVNVAPFEDYFMESVNSLRFAAKVKEVKTESRKNRTVMGPPLVKQKSVLG